MTDFSTISCPSTKKTSEPRLTVVVPPGQHRYFMNCDRYVSSAFINVLFICLSVASTKCKPNDATLYHLFAAASK